MMCVRAERPRQPWLAAVISVRHELRAIVQPPRRREERGHVRRGSDAPRPQCLLPLRLYESRAAVVGGRQLARTSHRTARIGFRFKYPTLEHGTRQVLGALDESGPCRPASAPVAGESCDELVLLHLDAASRLAR